MKILRIIFGIMALPFVWYALIFMEGQADSLFKGLANVITFAIAIGAFVFAKNRGWFQNTQTTNTKKRSSGIAMQIFLIVGIFILCSIYWTSILLYVEIIKYFLIIPAGISVAILIFLLISPFLKNHLLHNPDEPDKVKMLVKVGTGRSVAIDFGGNFYYQIDDEMKGPVFSSGLFGLWMLYKIYIWKITGLHVYVPFFTVPKTYALWRYEQVGRNDKLDYQPINEGMPRYRSNHVRTAPFTWLFRFSGAEIQKVPFTIKGSIQMRIDRDKVRDALYLTESWNILLDQALNSVVRSIVRSQVTIDMVLGSMSQELWKESDLPENLNQIVSDFIFVGIKDYKFDDSHNDIFSNKKLVDLGIIIYKVDITDFEDELSESERSKLRASIFGREEGRSRDLSDQGVAMGQKALLTVLKENPELAAEILKSRSLVDAVQGGGSIEALLTTLIQSNLKK